jgi:hypothetical protein
MGAAPRIAGAFGLAGYALLLLWFTLSPVPGTSADVPIYLLSAQWVSPWTAASPVAELVARESLFPPLYPALLGLFTAGNVEGARVVAVGCLALSAGLAHAWVRGAGASRTEAALLACVFAALPASWLASLEQLSEPLYLALSLAALTAAARERRPGARSLQLAALLCGLAALTRSVGIALVVAYSLWIWRQRARIGRGWVAALGIAWALPLAWIAVRAVAGIGSSYAEVFESRLPMFGGGPLDALAGVVRAELAAIANSMTRLFALHPSPIARVSAAFVAALAAIGFARRLRRAELDAVYLALYLVVLALWPFPSHVERFVHAISPVVLFQALDGATAIAGAIAPRFATRARAALLLMCSGLALPTLVYLIERHREGVAREYAEFTHSPRWYTRRAIGEAERDAQLRRDEVLAMQRVRELVPTDACVFAVKPLELALHAGRIARLPPPEDLQEAEREAAFAACDFVFAEPLVIFPYRTAFHPVALLGDRLETLAIVRASHGLGGPSAPPAAVIARILR